MNRWISIIGITPTGRSDLCKESQKIIGSSDAVFGGERHFNIMNSIIPDDIPKILWKSPISDSISEIEGFRGKRVTILATGDPMVFGVGSTLSRYFSKDEMSVLPAPSAFSLAAARLLWPLTEVDCISLHGRPIVSIRSHLANRKKIIALSNDGKTPGEVCKDLIALGYGESIVTVLENMGTTSESITTNTANKWGVSFSSDLNTIAIECIGETKAKIFAGGIGLPDRAFSNKGLLTKREIRVLTLAALKPNLGQLLWDVGAGSGSVSIEWLLSNPNNHAIAIEKDQTSCDLIRKNSISLGVPRLIIEKGTAPNVLQNMPNPDAVFIGGGITDDKILRICWSRLNTGGRIVANSVTTNGEQKLYKFSEEIGGRMIRIQVSRSGPIGKYIGWKSLNPITQLEAFKQ